MVFLPTKFIPRADEIRRHAAKLGECVGIRVDSDDGEDTPIDPTRLLNAETAASVRAAFARKVYAHLFVQLVLTAAIAAPFQKLDHKWVRDHSWVLVVTVAVAFVCLCAIACLGRRARRFPTNYGLLFIFTAACGVMVGFISATHPLHSVELAAAVTCGVFLLLTLYAWTTSTDFIGLHPYFLALLAVVGSFAMCMWAFRFIFGVHFPWAHIFMSAVGVVIFTFYIVFDTQRIIGEWGGHKEQFSVDDYVYGTISLYIDVINLFLHILNLFGDRVK